MSTSLPTKLAGEALVASGRSRGIGPPNEVFLIVNRNAFAMGTPEAVDALIRSLRKCQAEVWPEYQGNETEVAL